MEVLSPSQKEVLNGREVAEKLINKDDKLKENTIRQRLSVLSKDADSEVAKLDGRQGYYLRSKTSESSTPPSIDKPAEEVFGKGRKKQPEEKFRYFVQSWLKIQAEEQPVFIEHTKAKKGKSSVVNKWKFPDLVSVKWSLPKKNSGGHDWTFQDAKQSLGEPSYSLRSIELKTAVSPASARGNFFQALSNSRWAHEAQLLIAEPLDSIVADELRRLGSSYGLTIGYFGISPDELNGMPDAEEKNLSQYNELVKNFDMQVLVQGSLRDALDWEHIYDLSALLEDFRDVFEYVNHCCRNKQSYQFVDWLKSMKVV